MHDMSKPSDTPDFSVIPGEMRERHHWVLWRIEGEGDNETKVPYQLNGKRASTKHPKTWSSFDEVVAAYNAGGFDGIGFVFTKDDAYSGIDLDHCRNPGTGEIDPWALEIIHDIGSYTEISFSGTGFHIIARATVPENRKVNGIEIYDRKRFFTLTGWHIEGTPPTIEDAQAPIMKLWEEVTAHRGSPSAKAVDQNVIDWSADPESFQERLAEMLASDPWFQVTWNHNRTDLKDTSLSGYDMSLVSQAVWNHDCDNPTELSLLIRLHREEHGDSKKKWKRRDYVCWTVGKALAGLSDDEGDTRALIKIRPGGLAAATRKAAAVLGRFTRANPYLGIYRYGNILVQVARPAVNANLHGPLITAAQEDAVEHVLEEASRFVQYKPADGRWVARDVPPKVARRLLARAAIWSDIPILIGITETPTLRSDSTVGEAPGYDPDTGLLQDLATSSSRRCRPRQHERPAWQRSRSSPTCSLASPSSIKPVSAWQFRRSSPRWFAMPAGRCLCMPSQRRRCPVARPCSLRP
jgi:hypothetical protein